MKSFWKGRDSPAPTLQKASSSAKRGFKPGTLHFGGPSIRDSVILALGFMSFPKDGAIRDPLKRGAYEGSCIHSLLTAGR